jgi:hypothetical protein
LRDAVGDEISDLIVPARQVELTLWLLERARAMRAQQVIA